MPAQRGLRLNPAVSAPAGDAATTDFVFSKPVQGYSSVYDRPGAQSQEFQAWMESLDGYLKQASNDAVLITYGGDYITDYQVFTNPNQLT